MKNFINRNNKKSKKIISTIEYLKNPFKYDNAKFIPPKLGDKHMGYFRLIDKDNDLEI